MTATKKKPSAAPRRKAKETKTVAKKTETQTKFDAFQYDAQKAFTEQSAKLSASAEEFAAFAKENLDALFASAAKAAEGASAITAEVLAYAKTSADASNAALKDLSNTKDVSEFVEKQSALTKSSLEGFAKQAQKLNQMTVAVAKECAEPMQARMAAVGDAVKKGVRV